MRVLLTKAAGATLWGGTIGVAPLQKKCVDPARVAPHNEEGVWRDGAMSHVTKCLQVLIPAVIGLAGTAWAGTEGACCLPDQTCQISNWYDCAFVLSGTYQGDGTTCDEVNCNPPSGACCTAELDCVIATEDECHGWYGGNWLGEGMTCDDIECAPFEGACCVPSFGCFQSSPSECQTEGGEFLGVGVACSIDVCQSSVPFGACCLSVDICIPVIAHWACLSFEGTWAGPGVACEASLCDALASACCVDGECYTVSDSECAAMGGVYFWTGEGCDEVDCSDQEAACCIDVGGLLTCVDAPAPDCVGMGGTYGGAGTSCFDFDCSTEAVDASCCLYMEGETYCLDLQQSECSEVGGYWDPLWTCWDADCDVEGACCVNAECVATTYAECHAIEGQWLPEPCGDVECVACAGDANQSGEVEIGDVLMILEHWASSDEGADLNGDGIVNIDDLLIVIGAWGDCG